MAKRDPLRDRLRKLGSGSPPEPAPDPGELAFAAERGAPTEAPVLTSEQKSCRICGAQWPQPDWVFCIGSDYIRGYCSPAHAKEGGDWIR